MGLFFFSLTPGLILAAVLFTAGCGHTPEAGGAGQADGDAGIFYSPPVPAAEEEPSAADAGPAPASSLSSEGTTDEAAPADRTEMPPPAAAYLISPNDVLAINVLGEDDLSLRVRVSENGSISFPLLGEVRAAGYSPLQFERRLEALLEKDYLVSPSVNVTILEYSTISVLGQVKKPGSFEIKGQLTVTQAIALAGGLTDTASPNGTKVIRKLNGKEEIIPIKLQDILSNGDLSDDISLKPGDLVVVPESFF